MNAPARPSASEPPAQHALETSLARAVAGCDQASLARSFVEGGSLLVLEGFLSGAALDAFASVARELAPQANRSLVPGFKKSGSLSRHELDRRGLAFGDLYRSPSLWSFLESVCGTRLLPCPDRDLHAYALYYYTEEGDHIGWHFDTSFYKGERFTVLLGLVDESSCLLECDPFGKASRVEDVLGVELRPGTLVVFNGDRVYHRVTPLGAGETRICLTLELLTDPGMSPWARLVSDLKDAFGYFGVRSLFRRRPPAA